MSGIALALAAISLLAPACGCAGPRDPYADLDRIHGLYLETAYEVGHLADFFDALEEFDLENAAFLEDAREAVLKSLSDAGELAGRLEELKDYEYGPVMEELGADIADFCDQAEAAMLELGEMHQPLLDMLQAMEPALREEAVLTQLDVPESDQEFTRRIMSLEEALRRTLDDLPRVEVPASLDKYKVLMVELFGSLKGLADSLVALAQGQAADFELSDNEALQEFQTILKLNGPLLEFIKGSLKVNQLEPCMQEVEDGFYELYLERGSRDEDKR